MSLSDLALVGALVVLADAQLALSGCAVTSEQVDAIAIRANGALVGSRTVVRSGAAAIRVDSAVVQLERATLEGAVALAVTGLAIAHGSDTRKTSPVSASFTATPTEKTTTVTCTGGDGTYNITRGSYEGTATGSDAVLTGKITLRTKSVVNTTTGYGYTEGKVTLRDADGKLKAKAHLIAVNTQKGILNGFLNGRVKECVQSIRKF